MYRARDGAYPAQNELPNAMATMLNGPFPSPSVGTVRGEAGVYYDPSNDSATQVTPNSGTPGGWAYKPSNGSLRLNCAPTEVDTDGIPFINW